MSTTPNIQDQKKFYDDHWSGMQPLSSYKVQRVKWIIDVLLSIRKELSKEKIQLLDLGCGDGRLAPLWQELTGATVYGLELSPQAVQQANERYSFIQYKEGNATATNYQDSMFHIIICQEVLEHVEEQQQLINEAHRILKKSGYLILTTPNKFYFDRRVGGNYSTQPIENIIDKKKLYQLLEDNFDVTSYTTLIYAKGDKGVYKRLTNRYLLAILRRLHLENIWKNYLLRKGYGLHMAVVCRKK